MNVQGSQPKAIRRMQIQRESDMPKDACHTPGGTVYGTTPGGSKIVYDRLYLLKVRDSPASHTPPVQLSIVPGVTMVPGQTNTKEGDSGAKGDGPKVDTPPPMESVPEEDLEME